MEGCSAERWRRLLGGEEAARHQRRARRGRKGAGGTDPRGSDAGGWQEGSKKHEKGRRGCAAGEGATDLAGSERKRRPDPEKMEGRLAERRRRLLGGEEAARRRRRARRGRKGGGGVDPRGSDAGSWQEGSEKHEEGRRGCAAGKGETDLAGSERKRRPELNPRSWKISRRRRKKGNRKARRRRSLSAEDGRSEES